MNRVLLEHKQLGETTKEFADRIRLRYQIPNGIKIAICGKLDPQASGITNVLVGAATKCMPQYLTSDKTYDFEFGLGISTDSDDIMGNIINTRPITSRDITTIQTYMNNVILNMTRQKYHQISAKKIRKGPGKMRPLWYWYKLGLLEEEDIPSKPVSVYSIRELTEPATIPFENYNKMVQTKLSRITNRENFNIDSISSQWDKIKVDGIPVMFYTIKVSSGFYVRMIANAIKKELGIPIHILSIRRTIIN